MDKNFTFKDAAEEVLKTSGSGESMHYTKITEEAIKKGLLVTDGKSPHLTMYAQITRDIELRKKRGEQPRFAYHGKGEVSLFKWVDQGLPGEIEKHNHNVKKALLKRVSELEDKEFEELIAKLLVKIGFEEVEVTQRSKDKGIDVRGKLVVGGVIDLRMAVQAKRWTKNKVQAPVVQNVRGSLSTHEQGLIVTTSDFTKRARREAARPDNVPIALMNGKDLTLLLVEHGLGIKRDPHEVLELSNGLEQE